VRVLNAWESSGSRRAICLDFTASRSVLSEPELSKQGFSNILFGVYLHKSTSTVYAGPN